MEEDEFTQHFQDAMKEVISLEKQSLLASQTNKPPPLTNGHIIPSAVYDGANLQLPWIMIYIILPLLTTPITKSTYYGTKSN